MIGLELDEAVARVGDPLDYQAKRRGLDPKQVRQAIEIWEALRPEAIDAGDDVDDEVYPMQLTEEAQVALHGRSDRIGSSLTAFVGGWFGDKIGQVFASEDLEDFANSYRVFACAKVGTEMATALIKGVRIGTRDVNRGVTRIDPVGFGVSLFEGSVIADDTFTPEQERVRRARWSLRYILATQHDRILHADASLLDDYELEYVDQLVAMVGADEYPSDEDMTVLVYLLAKVQPNNRLFGTTSGREELWIGQLLQVIDFLREFPSLDHSVLQEVEVRMVDAVRGTVLPLLDDPTLGGALHKIEGQDKDGAGGKCIACEMGAEEVVDRIICSKDARDKLDDLLPFGALPDMYIAKAKLYMPATGQQETP